jgi:hypothetical protein
MRFDRWIKRQDRFADSFCPKEFILATKWQDANFYNKTKLLAFTIARNFPGDESRCIRHVFSFPVLFTNLRGAIWLEGVQRNQPIVKIFEIRLLISNFFFSSPPPIPLDHDFSRDKWPSGYQKCLPSSCRDGRNKLSG